MCYDETMASFLFFNGLPQGCVFIAVPICSVYNIPVYYVYNMSYSKSYSAYLPFEVIYSYILYQFCPVNISGISQVIVEIGFVVFSAVRCIIV